MNILKIALASVLATGIAHAAPFSDGDAEEGQFLHAQHCVTCHAGKFGGEDGSDIYTRDDRRVTTASGLEQQITACTTMLNLALFPEDEAHIARYLNERYYKFE